MIRDPAKVVDRAHEKPLVVSPARTFATRTHHMYQRVTIQTGRAIPPMTVIRLTLGYPPALFLRGGMGTAPLGEAALSLSSTA